MSVMLMVIAGDLYDQIHRTNFLVFFLPLSAVVANSHSVSLNSGSGIEPHLHHTTAHELCKVGDAGLEPAAFGV
jgi:hypothetical protein